MSILTFWPGPIRENTNKEIVQTAQFSKRNVMVWVMSAWSLRRCYIRCWMHARTDVMLHKSFICWLNILNLLLPVICCPIWPQDDSKKIVRKVQEVQQYFRNGSPRSPRWIQNDSRIKPRCVQSNPKMHSFKKARRAQDGPKVIHLYKLRRAQDDPKMIQKWKLDEPKRSLRYSNMKPT